MLFSAFSTPAFALLNVPLIQKAVFSIDAPVMLSPGSLRARFRAFSVPARSFSSVSISPCLFSLFAFSRAYPLPKAPCSSAFVCKTCPRLSSCYLFYRDSLSPFISPYLLCPRLFFFANLVFLPHKLRRSSFPPRVFPFARLPITHRLLSSRLFLPAVSPFLCKTKEGAWPSLFTVPCCFSYPPQSKAAGIFPR